MRKVVIMGAGGRDFHDFNVVYRDDPTARVLAFTAAQIPGIEGRFYPASLAGRGYPDGTPIRPESELADIVTREGVDEVVLAYSDLSHETVMHKTSIALAAGADFRLLGPNATMLAGTRPVVAVCVARTGSGKSQTSRKIGQILLGAGLRVALVRHPMPYGDLEAMRVQRFTTLAEIDATHPTIEEREEYEEPVRMGMIMYAGVDYAEILVRAQAEADVIVWDGGNNDFPFFVPDLHVTVVDPLRAGHELAYHPGETNVRMADVIVVNKMDSASADHVDALMGTIREVNPRATVVKANSRVTVDDATAIEGKRVLVVEDGPTLTHGDMKYGAGVVAARAHGAAEIVDPRPWAMGTIEETFQKYDVGPVLPAMGYSDEQLEEMQKTIDAADADLVVIGTPIDLRHVIEIRKPAVRVSYDLEVLPDSPSLEDVLRPVLG